MRTLSPRQTEALARLICGEDESGVVEYRSANDIRDFIAFVGLPADEIDWASRFQAARSFVRSVCESSAVDSRGVPEALARLIGALLDQREIGPIEKQRAALARVNEVLAGSHVAARERANGTVELFPTNRSQAGRILDQQVHTVFGEVLADAVLNPARLHYSKARRHLEAVEPDYENAAKEAVCSVESLLLVLTGERDFTKAIRRATEAGRIPKPIDEMITKLYAYRGNEPGVAHGSATPAAVTAVDARLVFDLAAAFGSFLAIALRTDTPASDH